MNFKIEMNHKIEMIINHKISMNSSNKIKIHLENKVKTQKNVINIVKIMIIKINFNLRKKKSRIFFHNMIKLVLKIQNNSIILFKKVFNLMKISMNTLIKIINCIIK